ncbi:MAG: hypothetical protein ABGX27_09000 [Desulfurobacteriaceae bacterium]
MKQKFPRFKVPKEILAKAEAMYWFPFLKHDIFTRHYKVTKEIEEMVYFTYRKLSRNNPLVSIDELQVETQLPLKVVISAIQQLNSRDICLLKIVPTKLTEFVIGGEYDYNEIKELVEKIAGKSQYYGFEEFGIMTKILQFLKGKGVDIDNVPEYPDQEEFGITEDDLKNIDI